MLSHWCSAASDKLKTLPSFSDCMWTVEILVRVRHVETVEGADKPNFKPWPPEWLAMLSKKISKVHGGSLLLSSACSDYSIVLTWRLRRMVECWCIAWTGNAWSWGMSLSVLQRTSVDLTFSFEVSFLQKAQAHLNLKQMTCRWCRNFSQCDSLLIGNKGEASIQRYGITCCAPPFVVAFVFAKLKASTFPYIEAADGNNQVEHEAGWLRE